MIFRSENDLKKDLGIGVHYVFAYLEKHGKNVLVAKEPSSLDFGFLLW